ncbi:MAG: hypothetical protein JXR31_09315, partial [Prolixibacteraceae bacterium]|nr:hypothetical protein [Prolixibacteraceae bacterium]
NNYLMENYRKEDILAMYIIRQMVQWGRQKGSVPDFNERLVSLANCESKNLGYSKNELTLKEISKLLLPHSKMETIDKNNWREFETKNYIYFSENIIHEIWQKTIDFRNIYLVNLIREKKKIYNRIFIMMGFDHARETENELKSIYYQPVARFKL